jgi:(2Fe-2S) ferredoxin
MHAGAIAEGPPEIADRADVKTQYRTLADAAARRLAERDEAHKIRIQIGSATCENAAGAGGVLDEFRKHIAASGRNDIALHRVGCTGRCSCEPIVNVLIPGLMPAKYQRVDRDKVHKIFTGHVLGGEPQHELMLDATGGSQVYEFLLCGAERCRNVEAQDFRQLLKEKLLAAGVEEQHARVLPANCFGLCRADTIGTAAHVLVRPNKVVYRVRNETDLDEIVRVHVLGHQVVRRLCVEERAFGQPFFDQYGDVSFFNKQTRIALRNSGVIDPESLDEYLQVGGFAALAQVLEQGEPQAVIQELTASKLRGRGGGGYPTGRKWADAAAQPDAVKYIICNADEGDPGAFMDRSMLEGDPFSIIEGMAIGGFAIGAQRGFFYVRA